MHIVICPKKRNENLLMKVIFAVGFSSLVGLSGIMNGMISAEQSTANNNNHSDAVAATSEDILPPSVD